MDGSITELKELLIGAQLVSLNMSGMKVIKDGEIYDCTFEEDNGDCCGYAEIDQTLYYDLENTKENPVITKVEITDKDECGYNSCVITLFGADTTLADIKAECGSGSGWAYGAVASINVSNVEKMINENFIIAEW